MGSSPPYFPARGSPSLLERPPSPARGSPAPLPPSPVLLPPSPLLLHEGDGYILPPGSDENSSGSFRAADDNSIDGVFPSPSTYTFDPEESNSSLTTNAQWPRHPDSNNPPSPFMSNENSMLSMESDSRSLPEVTVRVDRASPEQKRGSDGAEPPEKIRKLSTKSEDDVDGETCPICLDSWASSGDHRLVALKCGHLFGARCVERWLRARAQKERSCPTCKSKASIKDMRHIYAKRLVAVDTAEITAMQKQVEQLQADKSRVEMELQKSKMLHRACAQQLEMLKNTMLPSQAKPQAKRSWRFALEKNLEISKDGGCRVLTYNCRTYELYASQKSANTLFPGYGIRIVNCVDFKQGQFVHLHPKPIRDISYSQPNDLLLSVALDSNARIMERGIPGALIPAGVQLWSCAWDCLRPREFYVGGVGGFIQQYDVRYTGSCLRRLSAPGDMSPVAALCSTEFGLLSCHLNSCWLWAAGGGGEWEPRALPVEGPAFMSLCYDAESQRALVSCRPGAGGERARLALCRLRAGAGGAPSCRVEHTFQGSARSSLMSRAAWVRAGGAGGAAWAAAHSESEATLVLHGLDGARTVALPAAEPALDVCAPQLGGDTILAALSDARLRIYKAVPTSA